MFKFESFVGKKVADDYNERLIAAVKGYGDLMQIGIVENKPIFKVVLNPEAHNNVCFIAGLHGNEPSGPLGVLKFLEDKPHIPRSKRVIFIPLANPTGYELNTRENSSRVDINRAFYEKPLKGEAKAIWESLDEEDDMEILHTLHEDPDASKFYVYYSDNKDLAVELRDLAKKYFKIETKEDVYGDRNENGLVIPPHIRRNTVEDRLGDLGITYITTEVPGKIALDRRVEYTKNAIKATIYNS